MTEILSAEQVADRYGVKVSTVRAWTREGRITSTKIGRSRFYRDVDILKFEEKCRKETRK